MAVHSKVRIYVHTIWGTYDHQRNLSKDLRVKIFQHFVERAQEINIMIFKMNIQPEHVHLLINLPSNKTMADAAQLFKGECSTWINDNNLMQGKFSWQRGYGAYSVSSSQVAVVENYIKNQDAHHKRKTFQEEYKEWAMKYGLWEEK